MKTEAGKSTRSVSTESTNLRTDKSTRTRAGTSAAGGARPETMRTRPGPMLRLVAEHAPQAPRTPFVLLVLALLGGGLVGLLLLSSAASADAFTHRKLQQDNRELSLKEQELGREVAASEAPRAIAGRARQLGLVPAADPGFLVVEPDGQAKVVGSPVPATSPPPPPKPTPSATPTPSAGPSAARPGTPPGSANPAVPAGSANPPTPVPPGARPPIPTPTPGGTR